MPNKENKIHTGFRLSQQNLKFIEDKGKLLGLNRTNMLDMLITIMRNNPKALTNLIQKQLLGNT
ncbi:MAG: hypothetical protein QM503_13160 [Bacteroidota bacterium]